MFKAKINKKTKTYNLTKKYHFRKVFNENVL